MWLVYRFSRSLCLTSSKSRAKPVLRYGGRVCFCCRFCNEWFEEGSLIWLNAVGKAFLETFSYLHSCRRYALSAQIWESKGSKNGSTQKACAEGRESGSSAAKGGSTIPISHQSGTQEARWVRSGAENLWADTVGFSPLNNSLEESWLSIVMNIFHVQSCPFLSLALGL